MYKYIQKYIDFIHMIYIQNIMIVRIDKTV